MMHLWQNPHHTDLKTYQSHTLGLLQITRDTLLQGRSRCINYLRNRFSKPSGDPVSDIPVFSQYRPTAAALRKGEPRHDQEQLGTTHYNSPADVELQATESRRDFYVFLHTPKKLGEQLTPDDRDPPQGWGIYFEEGFYIPPFFVLVLCVCVLGILTFGIFWYHKFGLAAFGVLGWVVGILSLFITVLFRWVE